MRLIPGVAVNFRKGYVRCTWDAIPAVAHYLDIPKSRRPRPKLPADFWAGRERFDALGLNETLRPYQLEMVKAMGRHDAFLCLDQMRLGKTLASLATVTLRGARRVLVLMPGYARTTWKREIPRWTQCNPLMLEGRATDRARYADGTWVRGRADVHHHVGTAEYVLGNFEIFSEQHVMDAAGGEHRRADLHGVSPLLSQYEFDACIIDEGHELKAPFGTSRLRAARSDLVDQVIGSARKVPIVYVLTATPMDGRTWHYYQLLRLAYGRILMKDGGLGGPVWGSVFDFQAQYSDGHKETISFMTRNGPESRDVWKAEGVSHSKELASRKKRFSLGRTADAAGVDLPPMQHEVREVELDPRRKTIPLPRKKGTRQSRLEAFYGQTISMKAPAALEEALRGCHANGEKAAMFVRYRSSHARVIKALEKAFAPYRRKAWKKPFLQLASTGAIGREARAAICDKFIAHDGPVLLIATIESLPGSVSLRGLNINHVLEPHDKLFKLRQALGRGHEPGTGGVTNIWWTVPNTYDDKVIYRTVEKLKALALIEGDAEADALSVKLQTDHEKDIDQLLDEQAAGVRQIDVALEDVESSALI